MPERPPENCTFRHVGPFSVNQTGSSGCDVRDGDGLGYRWAAGAVFPAVRKLKNAARVEDERRSLANDFLLQGYIHMSIYDSSFLNQRGKSGSFSEESDYSTEVQEWKTQAEDLAMWALDRMVNRHDIFGRYYTKDGVRKSRKEDGAVDASRIAIHFGANDLDKIIGLYSTSLDDLCLWLAIDFDRHDGDSEEVAEKNWLLAANVCEQLRELGFHPLLIDSNGKGGLHLYVFFNSPTPAKIVRAFGLWLVRDWEDAGLAGMPEVFPKQDSIDGKVGNFVRLFGLHHTHRFLSKVWDGSQWKAGSKAIDLILAHNGDSTQLIPGEAIGFTATTPTAADVEKKISGDNEWWQQYDADLRTLDIVGLFESEDRPVDQVEDEKYRVDCPWKDQHTTGDDSAGILAADKQQNKFPAFNCFHNHCKERGVGDVLALFDKEVVEKFCEVQYGVPDSPIINPNDPMRVARLFCKSQFSMGEDQKLVHYLGQWHLWDGRRYVEASDGDIRAKVWKWLATCLHQTKATRTVPSKMAPYAPARSVVTSVLDALKACVHESSSREMPCWIGEETRPAENMVAFQNGLLDVEQYLITGEQEVISHTPKWFSANCLPHKFDPQADCPMWIKFLDQVFEGDEERSRALAQWFGYCLTTDIRQHKLALFVGPPRSGKGTTMDVLTAILGNHNVANPTLTSLGGRFGLATLVGKQAAIIGDGHLGRQSDAIAILERLKSIVGGDPQNIDRKGRDEMTNVRVHARFTISVNELPRFPDASAALHSRFLLIPFNVTFEGREDIDLKGKLLEEIPGITNWALDGLCELHRTGRLLQPEAGRELLDDFVRHSSPVKAFIDDCCEVGAEKEVVSAELYRAWKAWCGEKGHVSGSDSTFGIKLKAAVICNRTRMRVDDKQKYAYRGIGLTDETRKQLETVTSVIG